MKNFLSNDLIDMAVWIATNCNGNREENLSKKEAAIAAPTDILNLLSDIWIKKEDIPEITEKTLRIDRLIRDNLRRPIRG